MSYVGVPSSEDLSSGLSEKRNHFQIRSCNHKASRSIIAASLLCITAITTAIILVASPLLRASNAKPETCGSSNSEALSRGCSFDVMSFAWLPERCFDAGLMEQFMTIRNWTFYADVNGTTAIEYSSVAAGEHDQLYVTQEFHMYHCTYMWRKMHRAVLAGKPLDGYIGDYHHTAHCEKQIMEQGKSLADISTIIYTKFVDCPFEQVDRGRWGWYRMIDGHQVHRNP